eukprot:363852-Chlamydomonas_euryale.AAC.5
MNQKDGNIKKASVGTDGLTEQQASCLGVALSRPFKCCDNPHDHYESTGALHERGQAASGRH